MSQSQSSNGFLPVEYRQLGKSGLRVSVPIVGAMSFGSSKWMKWVLDEKESVEMLKAAWDRGITTIDTANGYSNGESERVIGVFLKQHAIPREKVVILTKCFGMVAPDVATVTTLHPELANKREYVNQRGLSRAAILNAVNASLARLGTSYIDLLQIHRFDPQTPVAETMRALHDLVCAGKVRYIGASSMRTWQFAMMNTVAREHGWTEFVSMQSEYSLLYREEEREMIPYCNFNGIGLIPWWPLTGGALARPIGASETAREETVKGTHIQPDIRACDAQIIARVEEVAKKRGWSMAEVALAWVASRVASPIVGVSSVARLEQSMISGKSLTKEESQYLEELYEPRKVRMHA